MSGGGGWTIWPQNTAEFWTLSEEQKTSLGLKAGELRYRPLKRLEPALMLRLYMSMTCANTDKERISSWPAAGTEFLISAIISMTFFPVVRSNPSRRELLCICKGAIRLTNLSGKKKKKKISQYSQSTHWIHVSYHKIYTLGSSVSKERRVTFSSLKAVKGPSILSL